ncbi:MAG: formate dehydrogenase subunit alpha [Pseudomonadota bacterium]
MEKHVRFVLDGKQVTAKPDETIWQVAHRLGIEIPHLCYRETPGYRADGNCRSCVVEIEGEERLAAACLRKPADGMKVSTAGERADAVRRTVMELLLTDQPPRKVAHDPASDFWGWADRLKISESRFPARAAVAKDTSHPAMAVHLDACIHCGLCVCACREVQVNDVIGMAARGPATKVVFDFDDPMGESTCVACGECVQVCPTGALMPANLVDEKGVGHVAADRRVQSVCPYCGVGCQVVYHLKGNTLLFVEGEDGPANEDRLCVKGRFGLGYVAHQDRLQKPLIRRRDVPKEASPEFDSRNPLTHFREASWEEALVVAAEGFRRILARNGKGALAGLGSAKCSNEEAYLFQKLVRTGFGSNHVDHCTRLCHASSVAALLETIGSGAVTAPFTEVLNSDFFIVTGSNPTENHPVAATYFKNAVQRGARLAVIDPRGQALKRYAAHMLQIKPGSDVSLLNGMLHVLVAEGLYDRAFVAARTEGFEELRAHLEAYPPERVAATCGIDAGTIRQVAREYAKAKAAMIFWGMGVTQHVHGTDNSRCLISLALLCGHLGRPGAGLHPLRGQNNVQGASDAGLIPMMYPNYRPVASPDQRAFFEKLWGAKLDPDPGLTVVEMMEAVHGGRIRGMYFVGENPAMSDPDANRVRSALIKLEHLVSQEIFLTETAAYADVVLPASAWPEKDGTATNTNRQIQMGRKALEPPGDAREDWWIIQEIARRLGLDWRYTHPRDVYDEMGRAMPSLDHISWDRLEREGAVTYPCDGPSVSGRAIVFGDRFPTQSGRGRLVPVAVVPPDEVPDKEYPMVLITGRKLEHWHTGEMTRRVDVLDALEPEAVASLNAADLERFGIGPGGRIRVETRRGGIELTARVDPAVPQGAIFVAFCYAEASANRLTNAALDPYGKIPELKYCAARVEALGEKPNVAPRKA